MWQCITVLTISTINFKPHQKSAKMDLIPNFFYNNQHFTDFDELSESLRYWNITITQLQTGKFSNTLKQLSTGNIQLTFASFGGVTQQVGDLPPGETIALLADPTSQIVWRKKKSQENSLLMFPDKSELDALTKGSQNSVFTITLAKDMLRTQFTEKEYDTYQQLSGRELITLPEYQMRMLRRNCQKYFQTIERDPELSSSHFFQHAIEDELSSIVCNAFLSADTPPRTGSRTSSVKTWRNIENCIEMSIALPIKVGNLCKTAGVSERTLLRLFHERFGMSPKTYLTWNRFNKVRRELKKYKKGSVKISDIANAFGFWHMGQFAADYRRLFDELPSETLKKC